MQVHSWNKTLSKRTRSYWGSNPGSRYVEERIASKTNVLTTTLYNRLMLVATETQDLYQFVTLETKVEKHLMPLETTICVYSSSDGDWRLSQNGRDEAVSRLMVSEMSTKTKNCSHMVGTEAKRCLILGETKTDNHLIILWQKKQSLRTMLWTAVTMAKARLILVARDQLISCSCD